MPKQRDQKLKDRDSKIFKRVKERGKMILPLNNDKFDGKIHRPKTKRGKWKVVFYSKAAKHLPTKKFDTEEEAERHLVRQNLKKGLKIRNIIYRYKNENYCELNHGRMMKFSSQDYDLVDKYTWRAHYDKSVDDYYTDTDVNGITRSFLQEMYPEIKKGESGDHIDSQKKWDNTRENTRIATASVQNTNKGMQSNNTSGYKGVKRCKGYWEAGWKSEETKRRETVSFSIEKFMNQQKDAFQLAVEAREEGMRQNELYKLAGQTDVYDPLSRRQHKECHRLLNTIRGVSYSERDGWRATYITSNGKRVDKYFRGKKDDKNAYALAVEARKIGYDQSSHYDKERERERKKKEKEARAK